MKRSILFYGAIAGLLLTVYVTMLDATKVIYQTTWGAYLGYLAILILPICIFLALYDLNKKQRELLFWKSLLAGLGISFLAASIYNAYTFIDIRFFHASHLENLFIYTEDQMKLAGNTTAEIAQAISDMKLHYFSWNPYRNTYTWYLIMGTVYTILIHLVFKWKNRHIIHN